MQKAVFLDRDGVLNFERGYTFEPQNFWILPEIGKNLKRLQEMGYLLIVISNQGGIGKGLYTHQQVEVLHELLQKELLKDNVVLTEIYYCPHHPEQSNCICRKPDSVLIEKALARFKINPGFSYFVGDKERDLEAAQKAGVTGIYLASNTSFDQIWQLGLI